jgi:hypothetical protein
LLSAGEHLGQSEIIEIAKGKYEIKPTLKGAYKQKVRELYIKKANGGKTGN